MDEKRKFARYRVQIKSKFEYYEGNPEKIDTEISVPHKGKGLILDISQGGAFLISDEKVSPGMPVIIQFSNKNKSYNKDGVIVRTGLLKSNPSEIAKKFEKFSKKNKSYIAIEFNSLIEEFNAENFKK